MNHKGTRTSAPEILERNQRIFDERQAGASTKDLAEKYGVSQKNVYLIYSKVKRGVSPKPATAPVVRRGPYHKKKQEIIDIELTPAPKNKIAVLLVDESSLTKILENLWK